MSRIQNIQARVRLEQLMTLNIVNSRSFNNHYLDMHTNCLGVVIQSRDHQISHDIGDVYGQVDHYLVVVQSSREDDLSTCENTINPSTGDLYSYDQNAD